MPLPGVSTRFAQGQLGQVGAPIDNVFALIGPCSLGRPGTVVSIADPNSIASTLGNGPGPELARQILDLVGTTVHVAPGYITAGSIGAVSKGRSAEPTLSTDQLLGIGLTPVSPSSDNTGTGRVTFAATSDPVGKTESVPDDSADYTSLQIEITTAGGLGAAVMTVRVGGVTMKTGVTVPSGTYAVVDPSNNETGLVLTFAVPLGGTFALGDIFTAVPTQNDGYDVLVTIVGINSAGVAQFTISLDGGLTTGGVVNAPVGDNVTSFGATTPTISLSGTPSGTHRVALKFTQQGTASSVAAQAGTWAGYMFDTASTRTHTGTAKITTPASGRTSLVVVAITTGGTCVGSATSSAPTTGTGTGAGTITIDGTLVATFATNHFPAVFTDLATGIVLTFSGTTVTGDSYTNAGICPSDNGSGDGSTGTMAVTTATTGAVAVPVSLVVTADGTAIGTASSSGATTGTGTATGTLTIGGNSWTFDTPGGGSGTGGMPAVFTDATTGVVVSLYAGASGIQLRAGDTYGDGAGAARTTYAAAKFQYVLDGGSAVPAQVIPSNGSYTGLAGDTGVNIAFANTGGDLYTVDSVTPANTTRYNFNLYAMPFVYDVPDSSNGSLTGLRISLPFGVYQVDDAWAFKCVAPSVSASDLEHAMDALVAADNVSFSRVIVAAGPATFAAAATLATEMQARMQALAADPIDRFVSAVVFGPDLTSATSGATPDDFTAATGDLALERVTMTCGADRITSAMTGRTDLRNCGFVIAPRMASIPISEDVGAVQGLALVNDVSTTTSVNDATAFNQNRGLTTMKYSGAQGVYASNGLTLAASNSDYSKDQNRRVIDAAATISRTALLQYVNGKVRTVKGPVSDPATGTIDPVSAGAIESNVNGQLQSQLVTPGNAQDTFVNVNRTVKVLQTSTLPVTIGVMPYGYTKNIEVTIGLVVST